VSRLIVRRLLLGVVTLWLVSIVVFAATQALPGDAALIKLGRDQTPQALAQIRNQLHLNQSKVQQYFNWVGDTAQGNLGNSFASGQSVSSTINSALGNTLILVLFSALVGFPLALGIGIWSAVKRDRAFDHVSTVVLLVIAALPEFVLGIGLILLFSTSVFHWFPAVSTLDPSKSTFAQLNMVILPALTLGLAVAPYVGRMIRASMIEVLESDYVAMARLKGLRERRVILRHAFVNGSGPTLQASAIALAYLAGGVVVVEAVFRYPGLGTELINAVKSRDVPVVQAITLIFASVYIVVNIVADVLTVLVTPRLRTASR